MLVNTMSEVDCNVESSRSVQIESCGCEASNLRSLCIVLQALEKK